MRRLLSLALVGCFAAAVAVMTSPASAGVVYGVPEGDWRYTFEGDAAAPGGGYTALDGTWNHDNGSDEWDETAIGTGRPGGVSAVTEGDTDYVRLQDTGDPRDHGFGDPGSNRKVFFGHSITNEPGIDPTAAANILDEVTISFRARLSTAAVGGPLDDLHPDGGGAVMPWPADGDGFYVHDEGKDDFGVRQASTDQIVSFALATPADHANVPQTGLIMNRLVPGDPAGDPDTDAGPGTLPIVPIADLTTWHEFWIKIEADTSGGGTHRVDIFLDGEVDAPQSFHVTAGDGNDFDDSYLSMGVGATPQSGAIDVDFFSYKEGLWDPIPLGENLIWDGQGDGNWGDIDLGSDLSRWLDANLDPTTTFPDRPPDPPIPGDPRVAAHAEINADVDNDNTVTVAADREAVSLTVNKAAGTKDVELKVNNVRQLKVLMGASFADGTKLTLEPSSILDVGGSLQIGSGAVVSMAENVTIDVGGQVNVAAGTPLDLGPDATLGALGGGSIDALSTQGDATVSAGLALNLNTLDAAAGTTFTKEGAGALAVADDGVTAASNTVFAVEAGVLEVGGATPLGGSGLGILGGGTLRIRGGAGPLVPQPGPAEGRLGYWTFDNVDPDSGAIINEGSAADADGTPLSGAAILAGQGLDGSDVLSLTGAGYVDLGNPSDLDMGTGDFALSAWINTSKTSQPSVIYAKGGNYDSDPLPGIRYLMSVGEGAADGYLGASFDDDIYKWNTGGATEVADAEWHHVVVVREGDRTRLYVDGWVDGQSTLPPANLPYDLDTSNFPAYIGTIHDAEYNVPAVPGAPGLPGGHVRIFEGLIDDVSVYGRALSPQEIAAMSGDDELDLSGQFELVVTEDSGLEAVVKGIAHFGRLTINDGVLSTMTASAGITFTETNIGSAPEDGTVGFDTMVDTYPGTIYGDLVSLTFVKRGPATLVLDEDNEELSNVSFSIEDGTLRMVGAGAWGGATVATLGGGNLTADHGGAAIDLTAVDLTVTQSGILNAISDTRADFGELELRNGILATTGAADEIAFEATNVVAADGAVVGVNTAVDTDLRTLTVVNPTPLTFVKDGPAAVVLDEPNTTLDNTTFEVRGGQLIGLHESNPFGGAAFVLTGGELVLGSKKAPAPGDVTYENAVTVTDDSGLTAGMGGQADAVPGPLTVTLGTTATGIQLDAGLLTVRATDDYDLSVPGPVGGAGGLALAEGDFAVDQAITVGTLIMDGGNLIRNHANTPLGDVTVGNTLLLRGSDLIMDESASRLVATDADVTIEEGQTLTIRDQVLEARSLQLAGTLNRNGVIGNVTLDTMLTVDSVLDMTGAVLTTNLATQLNVNNGGQLTVPHGLVGNDLNVAGTVEAVGADVTEVNLSDGGDLNASGPVTADTMNATGGSALLTGGGTLGTLTAAGGSIALADNQVTVDMAIVSDAAAVDTGNTGLVVNKALIRNETVYTPDPGAMEVVGENLATDAEILFGEGSTLTVSFNTDPTLVGTNINNADPVGSYEVVPGLHTVSGSGADIWGAADQFFYAHGPDPVLLGDQAGETTQVELVADITSFTGTNPAQDWQKAGLMLRNSLDAGSTYAYCMIRSGDGIRHGFQGRTIKDDTNSTFTEMTGSQGLPETLRLVCDYDPGAAIATFTAYEWDEGLEDWLELGNQHTDIEMPDGNQLYYGLAVTSHDQGEMSTGVFENLDFGALQPEVGPIQQSMTSVHATGNANVFLETLGRVGVGDPLLGNVTIDADKVLMFQGITGAGIAVKDVAGGDNAVLHTANLTESFVIDGDIKPGKAGATGTLELFGTLLEMGENSGLWAELGDGEPNTDLAHVTGALTFLANGTLTVEAIDRVDSGAPYGFYTRRVMEADGQLVLTWGHFEGYGYDFDPENPAVIPSTSRPHLGYGIFLGGADGSAVDYVDYAVVDPNKVATGLQVHVFQAGAGDADGNQEVNSRDILAIKRGQAFNNPANWPADWTKGDFDNDQDVDSRDILAIKRAGLFNQGQYASLAPAGAAELSVDEMVELLVWPDGTLGFDTHGQLIDGFIINAALKDDPGNTAEYLPVFDTSVPAEMPWNEFATDSEVELSDFTFSSPAAFDAHVLGKKIAPDWLPELGRLAIGAGTHQLMMLWTYQGPQGYQEGFAEVTYIPEPGTVVMLASGLLGLVLLVIRRRRRAA